MNQDDARTHVRQAGARALRSRRARLGRHQASRAQDAAPSLRLAEASVSRSPGLGALDAHRDENATVHRQQLGRSCPAASSPARSCRGSCARSAGGARRPRRRSACGASSLASPVRRHVCVVVPDAGRDAPADQPYALARRRPSPGAVPPPAEKPVATSALCPSVCGPGGRWAAVSCSSWPCVRRTCRRR